MDAGRSRQKKYPFFHFFCEIHTRKNLCTSQYFGRLFKDKFGISRNVFCGDKQILKEWWGRGVRMVRARYTYSANIACFSAALDCIKWPFFVSQLFWRLFFGMKKKSMAGECTLKNVHTLFVVGLLERILNMKCIQKTIQGSQVLITTYT